MIKPFVIVEELTPDLPIVAFAKPGRYTAIIAIADLKTGDRVADFEGIAAMDIRAKHLGWVLHCWE